MRAPGLLLLAACACAHAPDRAAPVAAQPAGPAPRLFELPPAILYKEARELMAQGKWDAARERLDVYLRREPDSARALFDSGWLSEKRGDPQAAQDDYRRALQGDPSHVGAAVNLARLLGLRGKLPEAEAVLRTALERREGEPRLLDALSAALRAQKKLDEAEAAAKQVLARHPRDAGAYRNLAAIEADRGHLRLAEAALGEARRLDDKDASILNSLGLLAMKRDDVSAARADFEQAAQLEPKFAPAWANLCAVALAYRDYPAAEKACAAAVQLDDARWETHLARGWALEGLRKPKEARGEYEKVLALEPSQEDALYGRALSLKAENDLPSALQAFKEYAARPHAAHLKEAQNQMAAIDLRLKNPPAKAAEGGSRPPSAALDLSKLPQGADPGPSSEKLPPEEAPAPPPR